MYKKILILFALFISFVFQTVQALDSSNEYTITSYNIDIVVNENNIFDITETIEADYKVSKHGIIREIPMSFKVRRLDGTISRQTARITDISVNEEFNAYSSNGDMFIKIGSASKTLTGKNEYIITYKYNNGSDKNKNFDELYFNIVGLEWDTSISNVTFKITMPKDFDENKLGFSVGKYGSTNSENLSFTIDGNIISGFYEGPLKAREGINVRLELPEGYFEDVSNNLSTWDIFCIGLSIVFAITCFMLWLQYGKDEPVIETVEFYPPEGRNSVEIGFLYKGYANDTDVISLLIYLANKGYLFIEEYDEKTFLLKNKSFRIIKIKDYDGSNRSEKLFMDGLFAKGNIATRMGLQNSFYIYLNKIKANINTRANRLKIFYSSKIMLLVILMISIIIFLLVKSITYTLDAGFLNLLNIQYVTSAVSIIIMTTFLILMPKRTRYGNEILGKIRGFKNFLETAEKDKLESLVMQNPEYFYNILPYAYVLGISDKWIKKFEAISFKSPEWYSSNRGAFNVAMFNSFMKTTMASAESSMSSMPSSSSSSGGGFSGGGFSGGGGGGGGGKSW